MEKSHVGNKHVCECVVSLFTQYICITARKDFGKGPFFG